MRETADHLRLFTIDDPFRREPDHETERDAVQAIVMAARRLQHAEARFETAVQAGRREGLTWRQIGTAADRPFQTLQRRATRSLRGRPTGATLVGDDTARGQPGRPCPRGSRR